MITTYYQRSKLLWHRSQRRLLVVLCQVTLVLGVASCASRPPSAPRLVLNPTSMPAPTSTPSPTLAAGSQILLTPTSTPTPAYLISVMEVGHTFSLGNLELTVVRTLDAPPLAEQGRQWILLDVAIQNTGHQVISINSTRDLVLKDNTNQVYKINTTATAAIGGTTLDVDLAPGEIVKGRIGFDVPEKIGELIFVFNADKFDAGRIVAPLP